MVAAPFPGGKRRIQHTEGARRHGGVVVGSAGLPVGMGLQSEAVGTQDAQNALGVDRVWSALPPRGPCDALVLESYE